MTLSEGLLITRLAYDIVLYITMGLSVRDQTTAKASVRVSTESTRDYRTARGRLNHCLGLELYQCCSQS